MISLIKRTVILCILVFSLNIGTAQAERVVDYPQVEGRVKYVSRDGLMWIETNKTELGEYVKVKQVAIETSHYAIGLATLGREVRCGVIYETPEFKGVICSVKVTDYDRDDTLAHDKAYRYPNANLTSNLYNIGAAEYKCTETDRQNITSDAPEWLRELCSKN